jgi:hypothetical protein
MLIIRSRAGVVEHKSTAGRARRVFPCEGHHSKDRRRVMLVEWIRRKPKKVVARMLGVGIRRRTQVEAYHIEHWKTVRKNILKLNTLNTLNIFTKPTCR